MVALVCAYGVMLAANALDGRPVLDPENVTAFVITVPLWLFLASIVGLYHLYGQRVDHTFVDELLPVFMVTTVWIWFLTGVDAGLDADETQLYGASALWAGATVLILLLRALTRRLATRRAWFRQEVLLVGGRENLERVHDRIARHPECGLDPAARASPRAGACVARPVLGRRAAALGGLEEIGSGGGPERLAAWASDLGLDRVIIAGPVPSLGERGALVRALTSVGITIDEVAAEPEALLSTAVLHHLEGLPVLTIRPAATTRGAVILKRSLDVCVSAAGLTVLFPALCYIALRVKLDSAGPVFFEQTRTGRYGEPFELLEFRTMQDGAEHMQAALSNGHTSNGVAPFKLRRDPRVTVYGARLRRWSVDELPQLWNVLRGDMSLVGPRPLPVAEAELVPQPSGFRTSVRPGSPGPGRCTAAATSRFARWSSSTTRTSSPGRFARTCGCWRERSAPSSVAAAPTDRDPPGREPPAPPGRGSTNGSKRLRCRPRRTCGARRSRVGRRRRAPAAGA